MAGRRINLHENFDHHKARLRTVAQAIPFNINVIKLPIGVI